jgi:hypothetical protein
MHETVVRTRKLIHNHPAREAAAALLSERLQGGGLSRALSEPLATHLDILYRASHGWIRAADGLAAGKEPLPLFEELLFLSRHLRATIEDLAPFLERAEDILGDKEETTHRESGYEREVAPFTRLDTTAEFRALLQARPGFGAAGANEGAQTLSDLLKVVFLDQRLREEPPKAGDLYAMLSELHLDARRHLMAALDGESVFMKALAAAGGRTA